MLNAQQRRNVRRVVRKLNEIAASCRTLTSAFSAMSHAVDSSLRSLAAYLRSAVAVRCVRNTLQKTTPIVYSN